MLSVIKTLLEFQNILLGIEITICIDYMNNMNLLTKYILKYIQHWHQLIEEFSPKLIYLKSISNNLANELSRLDAEIDVAEVLCIFNTKEDIICTYYNELKAKIYYSSATDNDIPENTHLLST